MKTLLFTFAFSVTLAHISNAQTDKTPAQTQSGRSETASFNTQIDLAEANKLNATVLELFNAGKFKEALPLAQRVADLRVKALGETNSLVVTALFNLAVIQKFSGEGKAAEPTFERILLIKESRQVPTTPSMMNAFEQYICLLSIKQPRPDSDKIRKIIKRLNNVLLQDAVIAAGLQLPADTSEIGGGKLIELSPPAYPPSAKKSWIEGVVTFLIDIDETGQVVNATPLDCGWGAFKNAAIESARKAKFSPALVSEKAIKRRAYMPFFFNIAP